MKTKQAQLEWVFLRPKIERRIPAWRLTYDRDTFLAIQESKRRWSKKKLARNDSHFRFLRFHHRR
jgi:hypothetical protein